MTPDLVGVPARAPRAGWTAVCRLADLAPERGAAALVDGEQVALFRLVDGTVLAVQQHDPFSGAHVMSRGIVGSRGDAPTVTSPMYKQVFDLRTGRCLDAVGRSRRTCERGRCGSTATWCSSARHVRTGDRRTGSTVTALLGIDLAGRTVLVVGGGPVAARRAASLVGAGAVVTVVAPWLCEDLADAVRDERLGWVSRDYAPGDLDGAWLVHTATGDADVDAQVAADADDRRVWCVHAGDAVSSSAWVPAVARSDDVLVAVTAGGDPRRASTLRSAIAAGLDSGDLPLRRHRRSAGPSGRGSVALVGGGPGASGLVTVRGRRQLADADVVVVDRLGPRGLLAELADDVVVVDVGKTPGNHPVPQHEINALLVEHALAGRRVVRLKGGDPFVFGRGGEEVEACRLAGVDVEVVPGVTSAVSVPAAAGIPVTHRGVARGFSVLTGHAEVADAAGGADHTLLLLMGVTLLAQTCRDLVAGDRPPSTPVAVVEDGYGPGQRVTVGTLDTIAGQAERVGVRPPAVTVVGDVVRLSPHWG